MVKPVVTAKAKIINLTRPVVIKEKGGTKTNELIYLAATSIATNTSGIK